MLLLLAASSGDAQNSSSAPALTPDEAKARAIFERVIAFKTSVGLGQVPAMAAYLAGEFRAAGFPEADIHIFPLGETASMVVRYRGDGTGGKPMLLMSHMDVVTAKREEWQRDPFTLVEENGFFYGRGTFDIKGGLTAETATFLRLKAEGFVPTRDLILLFTGDEETSEATTADVAKNHRELIDADFALNADAGNGTLDERTGLPLFFSLGTAEKSYASYELTATNPGGHSSHPRVDNAIYDLADALKKVQAYQLPDHVERHHARLFQGHRPADARGAGPGHAEIQRESARSDGRGGSGGRSDLRGHDPYDLRTHAAARRSR